MLRVGDLEDEFQFYVGTNHPKREQKGGGFEMTFGVSHIEAKCQGLYTTDISELSNAGYSGKP